MREKLTAQLRTQLKFLFSLLVWNCFFFLPNCTHKTNDKPFILLLLSLVDFTFAFHWTRCSLFGGVCVCVFCFLLYLLSVSAQKWCNAIVLEISLPFPQLTLLYSNTHTHSRAIANIRILLLFHMFLRLNRRMVLLFFFILTVCKYWIRMKQKKKKSVSARNCLFARHFSMSSQTAHHLNICHAIKLININYCNISNECWNLNMWTSAMSPQKSYLFS